MLMIVIVIGGGAFLTMLFIAGVVMIRDVETKGKAASVSNRTLCTIAAPWVLVSLGFSVYSGAT